MSDSKSAEGAPVVIPPECPPEERVDLGTRVAYGSSAFAENLAINSVNQLANPVFNLVLGVSPVLVGTALAIPRIWDAIADPLMGSISDNWQSKWGRRRPFILIGALLTALCVAGIWMFPDGKSPTFYFWWLTIGSLVLGTAYTIFVVPYGALGLELTADYHERTKLMGTKSMLHKASGVVNQWLLKIVQLVGNNQLVAGSRICGIVLAFVITGLGAITAWRVKERPRPLARVKRLPLWESWKAAFKRPDFVRLIVAQLMIYASMLVIDNTGFYLNVFYVNGGDIGYGALMKGFYGMTFQVGGMCAIPFIVRLSRRVGKKRAFMICTGSILLAGVAKWFCYVPGAGYWLILPSLLMAPGMVAVMMLVPSMTADICDVDEVITGARREGMFNAVLGWMLKIALSGSIFAAGVTLQFTGWVTDLGPDQSEGTFLAMRIAFAGGTIVLASLALWCMSGYKVTQEMVVESRRLSRLAANAAPPSNA
jgi:GPH family glycoside/pentoside/hexuronide:cation symporter